MTKNHDFFKKCRANKFAVECNRISKTSQKVRRIWADLGKRRFFRKKLIHQKQLKLANLLENAVELVRRLKKFEEFEKVWEKTGFPKTIDSSETTEGSKFAVECDRISRTSQKVRNVWAGLEKRWVFQKESRNFQKWLDVANML